MNKVKVAVIRNIGKQGMIVIFLGLIPTHVWDFAQRLRWAKFFNRARQDTKRFHVAVFFGVLKEDLGAQANSEEGNACRNSVADNLAKS